jgi:hypothetical protein
MNSEIIYYIVYVYIYTTKRIKKNKNKNKKSKSDLGTRLGCALLPFFSPLALPPLLFLP